MADQTNFGTYREPRLIESEGEDDVTGRLSGEMERLNLMTEERTGNVTGSPNEQDTSELSETVASNMPSQDNRDPMLQLMSALLGNFSRVIGQQVANQGLQLTEKLTRLNDKIDEQNISLSNKIAEQ